MQIDISEIYLWTANVSLKMVSLSELVSVSNIYNYIRYNKYEILSGSVTGVYITIVDVNLNSNV